ncbi:bacteriocin immunity protein [Vagococcus silagei]|uniref:bacteriocin immunity protein n=1 Tax=Vagococcus silagei TaxID=2508885 RepID=UPI0013A5FE03|nr:bacteriocin immunity protein [Vagococcus silagei]
MDKQEGKELQNLLIGFYLEIKDQAQGAPSILTRLNIEVSRYLAQTHLKLSAENSDRLQKISELNYIRML